MSLTFEKTPTGDYLITETTVSDIGTKVKTVTYTAGLETKRVNDDPWRLTTQEDRDWFEKYYRNLFD